MEHLEWITHSLLPKNHVEIQLAERLFCGEISCDNSSTNSSGWWFQPLLKILVTFNNSSQYMEK